MSIPPAIEAFFLATNRADSSGFLDCFNPDAFLSDWGREFSGRDEIARWNQTDNIGVRSHLTLKTISGDGPDYAVRVEVKGAGFNGAGEMTFTLAGGRIARLVIA